MPTTRSNATEAMRRELRTILRKSREAFVGKYAAELNALAGLSREEIDAITPDGTDLAVYAALMDVVRDASRQNVKQAELKKRIRELGEVAVTIAKKVGIAGLV